MTDEKYPEPKEVGGRSGVDPIDTADDAAREADPAFEESDDTESEDAEEARSQ